VPIELQLIGQETQVFQSKK